MTISFTTKIEYWITNNIGFVKRKQSTLVFFFDLNVGMGYKYKHNLTLYSFRIRFKPFNIFYKNYSLLCNAYKNFINLICCINEL